MSEKEMMCSRITNEADVESRMVSLHEMKPFSHHPYHVEKDAAMVELMESIQTEGILVPLLLRPIPKEENFRYEIISGHRRKMAAEMTGLTAVPAIIREMDDDQAVIAMTDSNLHREQIKPSEKAYAYKMRLEAMKHQGRKTDFASVQLEPKSDKSQGVKDFTPQRSNELLAKLVGENVSQIKRYIRLTFLIPQILRMVDEEKLALTSAVELSFLKENEQYEVYAIMDLEQTVPSLSQANRLKRISQQRGLNMDEICSILEEIKPNQKEQIRIPMERVKKYFPREFTPAQQVKLVEKLLADWARKNLK